jgi:hypothetical protein
VSPLHPPKNWVNVLAKLHLDASGGLLVVESFALYVALSGAGFSFSTPVPDGIVPSSSAPPPTTRCWRSCSLKLLVVFVFAFALAFAELFEESFSTPYSRAKERGRKLTLVRFRISVASVQFSGFCISEYELKALGGFKWID